MGCHDGLHIKDEVLRHSIDLEVWKTFNAMYVDFFAVGRNVRLALSTDSFEQFKHEANHSIWPITVVAYDLLQLDV